MSPFWILLELRKMELGSGDNWNYKTCNAPVKSSLPIQGRRKRGAWGPRPPLLN